MPRKPWPTTNTAWPPPPSRSARSSNRAAATLKNQPRPARQGEARRRGRASAGAAQIEAAADAAAKELADRSAAMAVRLAGQILQAEIKPRDHARLVARPWRIRATEEAR